MKTLYIDDHFCIPRELFKGAWKTEAGVIVKWTSLEGEYLIPATEMNSSVALRLINEQLTIGTDRHEL